MHKLSSADGNGTILSASAVTTGRKLMGRWVYPLSGILSLPASTWTVTYRAQKSASASSVVAHGDVDILIKKADGSARSTIATNVANSQTLALTNIWETLTGTYNWPSYTVVDQTDYLEMDYFIEVTTAQNSKSVRLMIDNSALALADQTKIANVMFTYPNQAPVASFTFSPNNPLIFDLVTFDASASYDPDGSIVNYKWDFGDGNITTVTNPIVTHVYTTAGSTVNYTVTLTATDNEGATGANTQIVPVTNPSILNISLPAGTYFGPDPDNWLSQSWLLNNTGLSGTFTVRINNTHASYVSYDTHLIIALNNASYQYLNSLTVNATTVPKTSFTYGKPTPYGYTLTWENDIYPTWFSDTYVAGTVNPKSYTQVQVSVAFSNASGVRMHFDAYGSADPVPPPPTSKGHVTENTHEKDSTVLFYPPQVVQYYLTVISPYGTVGGQGWYTSGSTAYATLNTNIVDHGNGTRRVFLYWSGDASGTNYVSSNPIVMNAPKTANAVWKTQYYLTVTSPYGTVSGADWYDSGNNAYASLNVGIVDQGNGTRRVFTNWSGDASGTNYVSSNPILMNGPKTAVAVWKTQYFLTVTSPYGIVGGSGWYDANAIAYATLNIGSVDHGNGTRRVFTNWGGDASGTNYVTSNPITMNGPKTATAIWKTQYLVTFAQSGLDATATGTVVTINGVEKTYGQLPNSTWFDGGSTVTYFYSNVSSTVSGQRFNLTSVNGPASPFTLTGPVTVTGNYKTQYLVSFTQSGSAVAPTVTYTADTDPTSAVPFGVWVKAGSQITYAYQSIVPGSFGTRYVLVSTTPSSPQTVNGPLTVLGTYVTQYLVTFNQTGLDGTANSIVVTINGAPKMYGALPNSTWFNGGSSVTYSYSNVSSTVAGKRFILINVTGTASPISVTSPVTVTGNYKTQYLLTIKTSGLPSAYPTKVYLSGLQVGTASDTSAYTKWFDSGTSTGTIGVDNTVPGAGSTQYVFVKWVEDSFTNNPRASETMNLPKTFTALYTVSGVPVTYTITFNQTGVGSDFTGPVAMVDGVNYTRSALPANFLWNNGSIHTFTFWSPLVVTPNAKQYIWHSTTGVSTLQSGSITVTSAGNVTGHYKTQYYLAVSSPYGPPTPSGWFDSGASVTASVTSPSSGPPGTRYVGTGWTGTGSVPSSGTGTSVTFMITQPSSITWLWKTQYLVSFSQTGSAVAPTVTYTVDTDPTQTVPFSVWVKAGSQITYSYQSIVPGTTGVRYFLVSVNPASPQTVNGPLTTTTTYKVQYFLTVLTNPTGFIQTPTPPSNWYDDGTDVVETAPDPAYLGVQLKRHFFYWDVDGVSQPPGANPITVHMGGPHTATAHYLGPGVGGNMVLLQVAKSSSQIPLYLASSLVTVGIIASLWMRHRKRRR